MSLLIESIKLFNGSFYNLPRHEERMRRSLQSLFGLSDAVRLEEFVNETPFPLEGLFKCRILYDAGSREKVFTPYEPKVIRRVRVVEDDSLSYPHKFADRSGLNRLFELRNGCDDVMIVRNGRVTDCSFSNVVFRKGQEWFTPATPLLEGTMRRKLIDENKVTVREILQKDIRSFDSFKLVNSMLEFDAPEIEVSDIVF